MSRAVRQRAWRRGGAALLGLLVALGPGAALAVAAAPSIGGVWASQVQGANARLNAEVNPGGTASFYRFDYIARAAYEANVAGSKDPFDGASKLPVSGTTAIAGTAATAISPVLFGLTPGTAYRYRLVVTNVDGTTTSPTRDLATHANVAFALPDGRGWELVSPVDKNGGAIADVVEAGGGAFRAAAQGDAVSYASKASFAGGAGAAPFSQYISRRSVGGWSTENVTPAHLSGAYEGAPYAAFSVDLARSLYRNPARCPDGDSCLPGYRLRQSSGGALTQSPPDPGELISASQDLGRLVFADEGDLYAWLPPATALIDLNATPPVAEDPPFGAVSEDGARIYYQGEDGNLHLRQGSTTTQVDTAAGGGGSLEDATPSGSHALYSKAGHLHRYVAASEASVELVPVGVVAGSGRISADATKVLFTSAESLLTSNGETYDNLNATTKTPEPQVYLLDLAASTLLCVSCNRTYARPIGPSRVPGALGPHRPRAMSADGKRVFFDSRDALLLTDVNQSWDVYQWSAQGKGSCTRPGGCLALLSAGLAGSSSFVDSSTDAADAYFLTDRSLVWNDPGSVDLYDARIGGGFPQPPSPSTCVGDACQTIPAAVEDPVLTTVLAGPGNPAERYRSYGALAKRNCPKGKRLQTVKRGGKVVKRRGKPVRRCVKVTPKRKSSKRLAATRRGDR